MDSKMSWRRRTTLWLMLKMLTGQLEITQQKSKKLLWKLHKPLIKPTSRKLLIQPETRKLNSIRRSKKLTLSLLLARNSPLLELPPPTEREKQTTTVMVPTQLSRRLWPQPRRHLKGPPKEKVITMPLWLHKIKHKRNSTELKQDLHNLKTTGWELKLQLLEKQR